MKPLALTLALALLIAAACTPVRDDRPPHVAAATQTVRAALPLPPLPRVLRVWVLPQETAEPSLMPTITPKVSAP